jgi:hypothetical protein
VEQATAFMALLLSVLSRSHRRIHIALALLVTIVISVHSTNAQSKDRANPTRLTSNEITGVVDSENRGNFYYYSFMANSGELSITLTVDPGRKANDSDFIAFTAVGFSLFDRNAEEIASKSVSAANEQGAKQAVARVEITRRQPVVLAVSIPAGTFYKSVGGRYRIRIEGAVDLSQPGSGRSASATTDDVDAATSAASRRGECLPKQGTLIIKMKDGSKKIIDLSEAETVTVVP